MTIEVFDHIEQGTDEWLATRAGIPTCSEFKKVMAGKGPRGGTSSKEYVGRTKYMRQLAGEIITGIPEETYSNSHMDRGKENEAEARDYYAFLKDVEPVQVGFIRNGNCGGSPDSLIGADGILEIKDAIGSVQIERLLAGGLPTEHKAQCQGLLMVSGRSWVDFMSHSRGLPPLIVRVERDERYIAEIRVAVDEFVDELNALVSQIRSMQ